MKEGWKENSSEKSSDYSRMATYSRRFKQKTSWLTASIQIISQRGGGFIKRLLDDDAETY